MTENFLQSFKEWVQNDRKDSSIIWAYTGYTLMEFIAKQEVDIYFWGGKFRKTDTAQQMISWISLRSSRST